MARKRSAKAKPAMDPITEPTPELMAMGEVRRVNMAYRRTPVIDTLFEAGKLTYRHYAALAYYRNQASQAEDDYARSSTLAPERVMGGGGGSVGSGIPIIFTAAIAETGRIERDLGSLLDIARAIAVADLSLSQWCIAKFGGRERYDGNGNFVAMVPVCEKRHIQNAMMELKFAAGRITT